MSINSYIANKFHLERELKVFAPPHQETGVVGPQLQEVLPIDGEQSPSVGRGPE